MFEARDPTATSLQAYPRLLGDIGGTNARFGWQVSADADIQFVRVLPCAEHPSLAAAIRSYLSDLGQAAPPCAALGIANPVSGDAVAMTNHHWQFSIEGLRSELGLQRLLLLNDFTALALALPQLKPEQVRRLGGNSDDAAGGPPAQLLQSHGANGSSAAIGLIGPGTGLGVSGLLPMPRQSGWLPISGEGGHVTLAARTAFEFSVIEQLQHRYGHVSAERVLSGPGLVDLYHVLCDLKDGQGREITTPAEVIARARSVPGSSARQALDLFSGFLGSVAGDLALTLGAKGGIFIGGGIVPRLADQFDETLFRSRFEDKGRFRNYLQDIPVWVIHSPVSPALQGASSALSLPIWT